MIKYLKSLGFAVNNDMFAEHSWYFRNALVRANYNDLKNNIYATTEYLEQFFENLLLDETNVLKNRYMHLDYTEIQSRSANVSKSQIETLKCTLEEKALLKIIAAHPEITQKQLADETGISLGSVKRVTVALQEKGLLRRVGGKRFGYWEVN